MRKRSAGDDGQNTEAWMTTYADMMSLLLCFFVLLFAYSAIDAHKFREVVMSLRGALGILDSGPSLKNQLPAPLTPFSRISQGQEQEDHRQSKGSDASRDKGL